MGAHAPVHVPVQDAHAHVLEVDGNQSQYMKVFNSLQEWFYNGRPKNPVTPGVYHFIRENGDEKSRLHLRLESDGSGLLLVNASRAYHFNPTAAIMAYMLLQEIPPNQILRTIQHSYHVSRSQAKQDWEKFKQQFDEIVRPDGACPVCELDLETTAPFSTRPSAPYRMDLALTYRCNNLCAHCYNSRPRNHPELATEGWKKILDRTWEIGIPHIVFTGGEPTLRPDLPELIAHAEQNGQITGINTNGRALHDLNYVTRLVDSGLDHVQVTLESHLPAIHDEMVGAKGAWEDTIAGLQNVLKTKLFVMTNTTLLQSNSPYLTETLEFLAGLGVPTVGLNALIYSGKGETVGSGIHESELQPLLEIAIASTQQNNQKLIWYTPTQYCHFNPLQAELGVKGCTAALYNMCVESDGMVIPCQSYYHPLGNLIDNSWVSIWNHPLAVSLRERQDIADNCRGCTLLPECGGGCPLTHQANPDWAKDLNPVSFNEMEI